MTVTRTVVQHVRKLRNRRGLASEAFAQAVTEAGYPFSRQVLANQESGRVGRVSIDQVVAMSKVLGVSLDFLVTGPQCVACGDLPPVGFACNRCGSVNSDTQENQP